ncbi:ImmA/IrrE family metallo-endopeptidase [Variovorax paradoxus]|uniref:ImmA/IrrE family metallo-endopeptidase n=1 Tax=Variovorax paradoxus TaxID=34073 RepID=UPI003ECEBEF1
MLELVGLREQSDIDQLVDKILRDLGRPEPPLNLAMVRELLRLDLKYYSSLDVGPIAEFAHRIKVAGKRLIEDPGLILDVVKKAKLSGLWLPDDRKIFIDQEVPTLKHRWIEAHEISHSVIPWHSEFLLGDNEVTLNPACHEIIEAEANFGAGRMLFFGSQFSLEAKDLQQSFKSIQALKERYGNTLTSTFWRFVEERNPALASFGLISTHPKHADIGPTLDGSGVHHFITSPTFRQLFPAVTAPQIYALIERNASWKRRGPVVGGSDSLVDLRGEKRIIQLDGFCNTHQVLTLGWLCN